MISSRYGNTLIQWPQQRKQNDVISEGAPGTFTNITYHNKLNKNASQLDQSPARLAQANWNFVEKLLKAREA